MNLDPAPILPLPYLRGPSHTRAIFNRERREKTIDACCKALYSLAQNHNFYAIAVCGHSGFMGAMVAERMGLELLAVRKPGQTTIHDMGTPESPYDYNMVDGYVIDGGYIFLDDIVDSGRTLRHVVDEIGRLKPTPKYIGSLTFYQRGFFDGGNAYPAGGRWFAWDFTRGS